MGRVYLKNITPSIARPRSSSERKGRKKQNRSPRGQMLKSFLTEIQVEGVEWDRCFFWSGLFKKTKIQSWWVNVGFPHFFCAGWFFHFSTRFLKRSSRWDTFGCCFNRAFWVLQIWYSSHPENHESVEPGTLVHLENDIILILLGGRCGSC